MKRRKAKKFVPECFILGLKDGLWIRARIASGNGPLFVLLPPLEKLTPAVIAASDQWFREVLKCVARKLGTCEDDVPVIGRYEVAEVQK
jgi:hypothetical protein